MGGERPGASDALGRDDAWSDETTDDGLLVESLEPAKERAGRAGRAGRLRAWLASWALAAPGRRLSPRARALRAGAVVALVAGVLFAQLGGPALVSAGWARLTALAGATPTPSLVMTPWRSLPPAPALSGAAVTYTPDPGRSNFVYACETSGSQVSVWEWVSDAVGWLSGLKVATALPATYCQVKIAQDAPMVSLIVAHTGGPRTPGCERLQLFPLTGLGEGELPLPDTPDACLGDVWPSGTSLYYWWTNAAGGMARTGIARSDDLGASWVSLPIGGPGAAFSLAPAMLWSGSGNTIMTQVYEWPGPNAAARGEVWRSVDGGRTWRRALGAPLGAEVVSTTQFASLMDMRWPPAYAVIYNAGQLAPPWIPPYAPAAIQALQPDGSTWRALPPLPLLGDNLSPGQAPMGVASALTVGPGGMLLALGQKPGTVATLAPQRALWLWAWDPGIQRWRVGTRAPAGATLAGISWKNGPYAAPSGAYLWVTTSQAGEPALSWTFIPNPN